MEGVWYGLSLSLYQLVPSSIGVFRSFLEPSDMAENLIEKG